MQEYYRKIVALVLALLEIKEKNQKFQKERKKFIIRRVIPIAMFVTGLGIGSAGFFLDKRVVVTWNW